MKVAVAAVALVAAQGAAAFRDTSPFFLFSSSSLQGSAAESIASRNIATASKIKEEISSLLQGCPSDTYIIANQPGASAADFSDESSTPYLRRRLSGRDAQVQTKLTISNVVGDLGATHITSQLAKQCNAEVSALKAYDIPNSSNGSPRVLTIDLPRLSTSTVQREAELSKHDTYINSVISSLSNEKYTVIFRTSPPEIRQFEAASGDSQQQHLYDMDEENPSTMHANYFKRDITAYPRAANSSNGNLDSDVPLFEKYQFFNPALFMGISVSLLLLTILYVAISAVSGLQVSYYAFSKEYNPTAQKKQT